MTCCWLMLPLALAASPASEPLSPVFTPLSLPGQTGCVFSMYGTPGSLGGLRELVAVMRAESLGNAFDPGPTPRAHARPLFDYLAGVGWPVMCYPGYADMPVKGGRCVLTEADRGALAAMDAAGVATAVQLGEWGYYFHNLSTSESAWRAMYGKDYDKFSQLRKPAGLAGYDRRPQTKRECYEVLWDYFRSRGRDLLDRVISVTGHSHYEAYAGEWGARVIGLEVGENIAFTQSKLAFARGASRAWRRPWSVQISPWFHGACTTSGPLRGSGGQARGLDAGHSLSFYRRMWRHAWFAGAALVTPENSIATFFEKTAAPWTLTPHGQAAAETFRFMTSHDRGVPYTPIAVVLDHLAGYNGYMDKPWGILPPTAGDRQARDLFDAQLFPGADFIHHRPDPANPEAGYLRPTPYGELFDVQLSHAPADTLAAYPVLLLVGDFEFDETFVSGLEHALAHGRRVLLAPAHRVALGAAYDRLAKLAGLELLEPWTNPATGRPAAIAHERLARLADELAPVAVGGDPVQYQFNRNGRGWVVELVHNGGVAKRPDQPEATDAAAVAHVRLRPRFAATAVREWRSGQTWPAGPVELAIGAGQSAFVEFDTP